MYIGIIRYQYHFLWTLDTRHAFASVLRYLALHTECGLDTWSVTCRCAVQFVWERAVGV